MTICCEYPVTDMIATGANIKQLRLAAGYSVKDLQAFFNFENPQSIYKWESGRSIPSTDNLRALAYLYKIHMDDILVCDIDQDPGRIQLHSYKPNYSFFNYHRFGENTVSCGNRLAA